MVGLQPRAAGGARGKLSGDPAVEAAAVALLAGYSDPIGLLALDPADFAIATHAVNRAWEIRMEREDVLSKNAGVHVANNLAPMIRELVRAVVRAVNR